jgi:DNA topoisomerase II
MKNERYTCQILFHLVISYMMNAIVTNFVVQKVLLENLELEFRKLSNKARFIGLVVAGNIEVRGRKKAELWLELQEKGFDSFPKKQKGEPAAVGAIEDEEENEASPEASAVVPGSEYDYLLSMAIFTLTLEKQKELEAEKEKCANDVVELNKTSPKSLWFRDLEFLEKELDVRNPVCLSSASYFVFYFLIHHFGFRHLIRKMQRMRRKGE